MRIGILSYPLNNNYGCYLQAYALIQILKSMGHEVVYINRRHDKPGIKSRIRYFVNSIKRFLFQGKFCNPFYRYEWIYMKKKGKNMLPFFERYIPHTRAFYSTKALERNCQDYDAIIVGSDQVWRAGLLKSIEDYYLAFLRNPRTKRISYAASFGKKDAGYSFEQIKKCGVLISMFNAVSVREDFGIELIREFRWQCPVPQLVLDPTLLLDKANYLSLCSDQNTKEGIMHCYILDSTKEKKNIIQMASHYLGLKAVDFMEGKECDTFLYPSVQRWIEAFRDSVFVITDSFHGTVFSIIFNVPFLVIYNNNRGSERMINLLHMFNLESRMVESIDHVVEIVKEPINWSHIEKTRDTFRLLSLNFLNNSLI